MRQCGQSRPNWGVQWEASNRHNRSTVLSLGSQPVRQAVSLACFVPFRPACFTFVHTQTRIHSPSTRVKSQQPSPSLLHRPYIHTRHATTPSLPTPTGTNPARACTRSRPSSPPGRWRRRGAGAPGGPRAKRRGGTRRRPLWSVGCVCFGGVKGWVLGVVGGGVGGVGRLYVGTGVWGRRASLLPHAPSWSAVEKTTRR